MMTLPFRLYNIGNGTREHSSGGLQPCRRFFFHGCGPNSEEREYGGGKCARREEIKTSVEAAGRILDVKESQLTRLAPEHDAAGHPHKIAGDPALLGTPGPSLQNGNMAIEPLAKGIVTQFDDLFEFLQAGRLKAVRLLELSHQFSCRTDRRS